MNCTTPTYYFTINTITKPMYAANKLKTNRKHNMYFLFIYKKEHHKNVYIIIICIIIYLCNIVYSKYNYYKKILNSMLQYCCLKYLKIKA